MKVLVTGATGFVGSHLVDALLARGDEVRILVRRPSNIEKFERKNIEIVFGDIRDVASLKKATEDIDVVYHLAALLGRPNITSEELREVNVQGTENILNACIRRNIRRFVHFSSIMAVGLNGRIDETTQCNPVDPYGKSKYESERVILKFFNENSMPITILRLSMVYGPGEISSKAKMFQSIQKGTFRIIGDGNNFMSFVYVDNVVHGALLASERKEATGELYILSDERAYTLNEIVGTIAKELGGKMPSHIPIWLANIAGYSSEIMSKIFKFSPLLSRNTVKTLTSSCICDISKAKKELGYAPKIDLMEGVRRTVEWYRKMGILPPNRDI